jgi:hypothetical protein
MTEVKSNFVCPGLFQFEAILLLVTVVVYANQQPAFQL